MNQLFPGPDLGLSKVKRHWPGFISRYDPSFQLHPQSYLMRQVILTPNFTSDETGKVSHLRDKNCKAVMIPNI